MNIFDKDYVDFEFKLIRDTQSYSISKCTANHENIVIPSNYKKKAITSIGESAFRNHSSLKSIIIPDSATTIGNSAFYNCESLTNITIPNSVTTIGECAFLNCSSLTSITIPNSVTTIGDSAFSCCNSLISVTIGKGVTMIGELTFSECSSLKNITISDSVTSIGEFAFHRCSSLTSITIPDNVKSIGKDAFSRCSSLTSIIIPDSVKIIGKYAFNNCSSLKNVYYKGTQEQWKNIWDSEQKNWWGNIDLLNATIIFNYKDNEQQDFDDDKTNSTPSLLFKLVEGGNSYSVNECSIYSKKIVIPSNYNEKPVTSFDDGAFYDCNLLASIVIPDSITSIASFAFTGCISLKTVYYKGTKEQWESITINSGNEDLTNATIIYNYQD